MSALWVALAGGLGAGSRFVLDGLLTEHSNRSLPTATLIINVAGSFLLGVVTGWATHDGLTILRAVAGVGFLGGFTTFSTASVELVRLLRAERPRAAAVLAATMIGVSIAMAILGLTVGERIA
ncbi:fluoride efflux transporter FluC [Tessaracoccus sp. G1721]